MKERACAIHDDRNAAGVCSCSEIVARLRREVDAARPVVVAALDWGAWFVVGQPFLVEANNPNGVLLRALRAYLAPRRGQ